MTELSTRVVSWFSCGAASAVASKLACEQYGDRCVVVYCDTMASEHPDNARFFRDVEEWIGQPIMKVKSGRFASIDDVFERTGYMAGIKGARCTGELKRIPRLQFQRPDDLHVFGLTADEAKRGIRFDAQNNDLDIDLILIRLGITKAECLRRIIEAGIKLPVMYELGYKNNNCIGCVKATSPAYWEHIRRDFPEHFARRAEQSRKLGVRLTRLNGERIFIDELPINQQQELIMETVSCGPDCAVDEP